MPTSAEKRQAVLEALDQFERPLLKYTSRLLNGDEDSARDAVQHAFMKLCEKQDFDGTENVGPWLYTVCRNRAMDFWRQAKREPVAEEAPSNGAVTGQPDPAAQLEQSALTSLIQDLVSKLAASEREVADLWSQGFSAREISDVTGKSTGAIRVCLHRAIKSLRNHPAIKSWMNLDEINNSASPASMAINLNGQKNDKRIKT